MKRTIACGIAGVFAIAIANAGEPKGVVEEAIVIEEPLGGTIGVGYMTDFVFYGLDLGSNAVWTGVDYQVADTPLSLGVFYVSPTGGASDLIDDRLDLSASLNQDFGGFDTTLAFTSYFYPDSGASANYEVSLGATYSLGVVDWDIRGAYDFEFNGWFFNTGLSKSFAISDNMDVVVRSGVSYQVDYWTAGSSFNHVYVTAALPIALRSNVTLEPYVGGRFVLDAIDDFQDDIIHGGVSLSVSF